MIRSAVMDNKGELLEEVHVGNAELDEIAQQYEGATFLRQCSQKQYCYHGRDVLPETPDSRGSHGSLPKISLRLTSGRQSRPFDNAQSGSEQLAVEEGARLSGQEWGSTFEIRSGACCRPSPSEGPPDPALRRGSRPVGASVASP
ncbi:hypothetical protein BRC61_01120 [Halobacteriales archaeon QH_10_65_19]|nr:MAG: hypothetical protein BRC61_01120 [Halobacteriales archaeon QH_10_65_19]